MKRVRVANGLRWIGRVTGGLFVAAVAVLAVLETNGAVWKPAVSEPVLTSFLGLVLLGLVIGWWKETLGGVLALGGYAAFRLYDGDSVLDFDAFTVIAAPGLLYLGSWLLRRKTGYAPVTPPRFGGASSV